MQPEQFEGLAAEILAQTNLKLPVNALLLADALGLRLVPVDGPHDEGRSGIEIRFNRRARYRDRQEFIAGCAARWVILDSGHYATEVATRRLARALMLPRANFIADLGKQRDLSWLLRRQPHASHAMICARLGDVGVKVRAIRCATSAHASVACAPEAASTAGSHRPRAYDSLLLETR